MKVHRESRKGRKAKHVRKDESQWVTLPPLNFAAVDWRQMGPTNHGGKSWAEPEPSVKIATLFPVGLVDLSRRPLLFLASNDDEHKGRVCINLWPKDLPTVASFATEAEALTWLACVFSRAQVAKWFPKNDRR